MFLHLNPQSGLPLYRQMLQQFRERIAGGQLAPGSQLPSVRELSADLHVNPLTVGKVYQILQRDGLVEFRRGQGTYVAPRQKPLSAAQQHQLIQPALDQVVGAALALGIGETELQRLLAQSYATKSKQS